MEFVVKRSIRFENRQLLEKDCLGTLHIFLRQLPCERKRSPRTFKGRLSPILLAVKPGNFQRSTFCLGKKAQPVERLQNRAHPPWRCEDQVIHGENSSEGQNSSACCVGFVRPVLWKAADSNMPEMVLVAACLHVGEDGKLAIQSDQVHGEDPLFLEGKE